MAVIAGQDGGQKQFLREKVMRQWISETVHAREPKLKPFKRYKDEDEQVYFSFRLRPLVCTGSHFEKS